MKFKIVLLVLLLLGIGEARAQIITMDGYTLSNENINLIISITEILAETNITNSDKAEIVKWTIEDFKSAPAGAVNAYGVLNDWLELLDDAQSQFDYDLIKYSLYRSLYFDWKIPAVGGFESFLDIVQRYNPIVYVENESKFLILGNDGIIAQKDNYTLSNLMQESAVRVGEWLARAEFSEADKTTLREWVIEDFIDGPKIAAGNYVYFLNNLLPKIYLQNKPAYELESLREELYHKFYFAFQDDTNMANWNNNLMDVVGWYNPVIIEDKTNRLTLTRSAIDEGIIMHEFLEGIISNPVTIDDNLLASEKAILINSFINRADKTKYSSGSWFLIRSRALWYNYSKDEQNNLAKQMKQSYLSTGSAEQALSPLFSNLRTIIQQEQQILANIYAQSLYLNQQAFNSILSTQQRFNEMIINDFAENSTRQSLQLSGATILFETDSYFELEYEDGGIRYQVYK